MKLRTKIDFCNDRCQIFLTLYVSTQIKLDSIIKYQVYH
jgi:hypothetical protein